MAAVSLPPGAVILCGGLSRRMGRSKAWLQIGDRTMLRTVIDAVTAGLQQSTADSGPLPVVVVGADGQQLPPLPDWVEVARDEVAEQGPLQGMAAGLAALQGRAGAAFVSSCDLPLLRPALVARLMNLLEDADIVVPVVDGRHHPLTAVYRLSVLPAVRRLLQEGRRRPFFLFQQVRTREVGVAELAASDPELESLRNCNTPEEYRELLR